MDPIIDRLVMDLRDLDVEVRRNALNELSNVKDKKHVVAAIHWTMLNDMDDGIRAYAREIYVKIGESEKKIEPVRELAKPAEEIIQPKAVQKTAQKEPVLKQVSEIVGVDRKIPVQPENRPHIKPVLEREPNLAGSWSVHFSLISIGIIIVATLWHLPYGAEEVFFLDLIGYIGLACTIPGIILGIIGLRSKDRPTGSALWGIILNVSILLIGSWNRLSTLIWK